MPPLIRFEITKDTVTPALQGTKVGTFARFGPMQREAGQKLLGNLKEVMPKKTGGFAKSLRLVGRWTGIAVAGEVIITGKYRYIAPFVILGTKAHMIAGKLMHFEDGGASVFTYRVRHPGAKPKGNFIDKAIQKTYTEVGPMVLSFLSSLPAYRR